MADPEHASLLKLGKSTWNEWRKENPEVLPDLSELRPHISFQFDEDAHLGGYNFRNTSFEGADLDNMVFYDSDEFDKTILSGANLRNARLHGTLLHHVDLSHADLTAADMAFTIIGDTNLSRTKGLADVVQRFPSSIDVGTIEATFRDLKLAARRPTLSSEWGIPSSQQEAVETFLLNAGTPYHLINYYSQTESSMEYCSCFISYSHSDREFATLLHRVLQHKGVSCWLDEHQLLPGDDLLEGIDRGIRLQDKLLLCCSNASLESWWVDKEIEKGLQKEEQMWNLHDTKVCCVIPLDLDGFIFGGWKSGKSSLIRSRYIADFTRWRVSSDFEKQLSKLELALRVDRSI